MGKEESSNGARKITTIKKKKSEVVSQTHVEIIQYEIET